MSSGTPQTARKKKGSSIRSLSSSAVRRVSEAQSNLRECVNAINQMMQLPLMSEKKVRCFLLFIYEAVVCVLMLCFSESLRDFGLVLRQTNFHIAFIPKRLFQWKARKAVYTNKIFLGLSSFVNRVSLADDIGVPDDHLHFSCFDINVIFLCIRFSNFYGSSN